MRSRIHSILAGMLLSAAFCRGADFNFYRELLDEVGTNGLMHVVAVKSPLLIDTNNRALKIGGTSNSLTLLRERGEISRLRLGMSMSEVVGAWGKPRGVWSRCGGGPRFFYSDAYLIFHGDSLWEVRLPGSFDAFDSAGQIQHFVSGRTSIDTVVRLLGEPTRRVPLEKHDLQYCVYEAPKQALIVLSDSDTGLISQLTLQRREEGPFLLH